MTQTAKAKKVKPASPLTTTPLRTHYAAQVAVAHDGNQAYPIDVFGEYGRLSVAEARQLAAALLGAISEAEALSHG